MVKLPTMATANEGSPSSSANECPEFVKEFGKILEHKGLPPNEHLERLVECMDRHKISYKLPQVHPKYFLTHKDNRGKLLLSPHNAHRNLYNIYKSGADLKELANAMCIELPLAGKLRAEHLEKNKVVIQRADGLLPEMNGMERYVTVGTGHTTAICKHAHAGGKTPVKALQRADSTDLDVQKLCTKPNFKQMIEHGWGWAVVPAWVDEMFPAFAPIACRALNTRNHTSTEMGELETCMTLGASADDPGMKDEEGWEEIACDNIVSLCAPCSSYARCLLDFVTLYGGGVGSPLISFVNNVATEFGCNVSLGQTFWNAATYTNFASKASKYPMLRIALVLCNLTSDQIEDGIARLLSKVDFAKVAAKNNTGTVSEAEEVLQEAMEIAGSVSTTDSLLKPLGMMFVRVALLVLGKEKQGRERKVYTMQELQKLFLNDVSNVLGKVVNFEKWVPKGSVKPAAQKQVTSALQLTPKSASLSDHADPEWIASQSGYSIGKHVVEKDVEMAPDRLYTIFKIDDTGVELRQFCSYTGSPGIAKVNLEALLTGWSLTKTDPPLQMNGAETRPSSFQLDLKKHVVWKSIVDLDAGVGKHELDFWRRPDEVRVGNQCIKKGELVLVPVSPPGNISTKNTPSGNGLSLGKHKVAGEDVELFVLPVSKPALSDDITEFPEDSMVVAFWWVCQTTDMNKVNMIKHWVTQGGVSVPTYTNSCNLSPHTKLYSYTPPKQKQQPLKNAVEIQQPVGKAPAKSKSPALSAPPAKRTKVTKP